VMVQELGVGVGVVEFKFKYVNGAGSIRLLSAYRFLTEAGSHL
jgi:hypothetical protein